MSKKFRYIYIQDTPLLVYHPHAHVFTKIDFCNLYVLRRNICKSNNKKNYNVRKIDLYIQRHHNKYNMNVIFFYFVNFDKSNNIR